MGVGTNAFKSFVPDQYDFLDAGEHRLN